ncbi:ExbD/TolR family protein [Pseudorhodoferax sp.]|uniref:ExbD/TolR family protein n=1 Tax=Pseudorhodoferax sp. TaxID=1993553 RepID=UPI002DD64D7F|nr:biopolymer transporter ExbD [Pseudorhodoferax sp.]
MNFRRRGPEEPEINLIPFIDVLLVVLIFLMLSTTYSKYAELQIRLPLANAEPQRERPREVVLAISGDGRYAVDRRALDSRSVEALMQALQGAVQGVQDPVIVISADASTPHQAVVTAMDAARRAGLQQLTFATQRSASGR